MINQPSVSFGGFGSGREVRRMEDDALLAGKGRYTDDVVPERALVACFVRSPYAHARILAVNIDPALKVPGCEAVFTGRELEADQVQPIPGATGFKRAGGDRAVTGLRRVLALDAVKFLGEPVALVLCATLEQARRAAEAVQIEYEELPQVSLLAAALAGDTPLVCADASDNVAAEARYGNEQDVDEAFAQAAHTVDLDIVNQRLAAVTLEPRSVLCEWDDRAQRLTMQMSTQMPTGVRNSICAALGLEKADVRVQVSDVGGGFGMKTGVYPEDIALAYGARKLRRAVRWVAERSEEFLSATHGRDIRSSASMALDASGKITALRVHSDANVGAYATATGVAIQLLIGPWVQTSVYDIQNIDFHFKAVLTNCAPTGAYRGAGRPEAIFIMERLMDEAARKSGIDRVELRRRNFVQPEQMPYRNAMGQTYDSGRFESILDQGLALAHWNGFEDRAKESQDRDKVRGLGIATFLEWTGGNVFEERVTVRVDADGFIEVFSAVNAMGQGIATTLAQLVVDAFGVSIDEVRVVLGDTDRGDGFGSAGSRSLFTGGSALKVGAERTIDEATRLAAAALEASPADVRYAQGVFAVAGTDLKIGLYDLAARQPERRIFMDSTSSVEGPTWPNGCHVCEVELDPQTGEIEVMAYSSVNDVGRVINPLIVRGQLDGGAVQGIGQALYEQIVYAPDTGQLITGSLMDYAVPRADVIARFETHMDESIPCKNNLLGVKGVGELGTIGATPAVVNAVADALARLGRPDLCRRLQMPLSPSRVWELLKS